MRSRLDISRVLHAGYIFKTQRTRILFDPIFETPFSEVCYAYPPVRFDRRRIRRERFDAVFISHIHSDHCSLESLDFIDRKTPIYIYSKLQRIFAFLRMLGFERIEALELDEPVVIGDVKITPLRALEDLIDCLFLIEQGGLKVLNVVDAGIDAAMRTRLKKIAPFDVVLWPFQILRERDVLLADPTSRSFEARHAAQLRQLVGFKPRIVVPSSCQFVHERGSWYNRIKFPISYARFRADLEKKSPRVRVEQILPGDTWTLTPRTLRKSGHLSWVRRLAKTAVDYKFEPSKAIPTTREIAMKRPVISAENTRRVLRFCRDELASLLKRNKLRNGKGERSFWQLSLFDHRGHEIKFVYRFQGGRARHVPSPAFKVDYRTEIPLERLAFILDGGPAHMAYARVFNGPEDVFEDYLMSAFSRDMLAYQNGQLRRLLRPTRAR